MRRLVLMMGALGLTGACSDAAPCAASSCPPLEGTYAMQYEAPVVTGCAQGGLAAPPDTLQLFRQGSIANTVINGIKVSGQIYDTYDFSLSGLEAAADGGTNTAAMRGYYLAPTHPDSGSPGAVIKGTMTIGVGGSTGNGCSADRKFTGGQL